MVGSSLGLGYCCPPSKYDGMGDCEYCSLLVSDSDRGAGSGTGVMETEELSEAVEVAAEPVPLPDPLTSGLVVSLALVVAVAEPAGTLTIDILNAS
jgi:hypothetical protein